MCVVYPKLTISLVSCFIFLWSFVHLNPQSFVIFYTKVNTSIICPHYVCVYICYIHIYMDMFEVFLYVGGKEKKYLNKEEKMSTCFFILYIFLGMWLHQILVTCCLISVSWSCHILDSSTTWHVCQHPKIDSASFPPLLSTYLDVTLFEHSATKRLLRCYEKINFLTDIQIQYFWMTFHVSV